MGSGGGGGGDTTTVQKADPWSGVKPYLLQGYQALSGAYGTPTYDEKGKLVDWSLGAGPQYYPGQTVASPNWLEGFGQQMQLDQLGAMLGLGQSAGGSLNTMLGAGTSGAQSGSLAQQYANSLFGTGQDMGAWGTNALGQSYQGMTGLTDWSNLFGQNLSNQAGSAFGGIGGAAGAMANPTYANAIAQMQQMGTGAESQGWQALQAGLSGIGDASRLAGAYAPGALGQAMSGLGGVVGSGVTGQGQAGALQGMQGLLAAGDPMNNPYLASAMQAAIRPVTEQFTETVMPGIKQGAMEAGQMGSSRQGVAEGIASRGYQNTLADITAQMGSQAYGQGLQAMQAGAGIGQGLMGAGMGAAGQLGQLGGQLGQLGLGAGGQMAGIGQGLYGQAGGLQQALLGGGLDLGQLGLAGAQGQAGLGTAGLDRTAMLQQAMQNAGLNLMGQSTGATGAAGELSSGLYDTGMTAAGRGLAFTPQMLQSLGYPGQLASQIGTQLTADQQSQINADMARWNFQQQLPYSMLSDYMSLLAGAPGGTTASTMYGGQQTSNPLMGALGGASSGAAVGSMFGPWGTGIGAIGGGLLGLFG